MKDIDDTIGLSVGELEMILKRVNLVSKIRIAPSNWVRGNPLPGILLYDIGRELKRPGRPPEVFTSERDAEKYFYTSDEWDRAPEVLILYQHP